MSLVRTDKNIFITTALSFYNILYTEIDIAGRKLTTDDRKGLFGSKNPVKLDIAKMENRSLFSTIETVVREYNSIEHILSDEDTFFSYVLDYAIFLRTMEKTILYTNCKDYHYLYADISENGDIVSLNFHDDNSDISIRFEESKITNILSNQTSMIYDNKDTKLKFIEITIDRLFGKEMTTKIKYVYPEGSPQLNDITDEIMFKNVIHIFKEQMVYLFKEIMDDICRSFYKSLYSKDDSCCYIAYFSEIVENGLYYDE